MGKENYVCNFMKGKVNIMIKILNKLLVIIVMLFIVISLTGCKNITLEELQAETINYFDTYLQKMKNKNLEYSTILIEYEVNNAKTKIENAIDTNEVKQIKKEYKSKLNNLELSKYRAYVIKKGFENIGNYYKVSDVKVIYYLGNYNGAYVSMIDKNSPPSMEIEKLYDYYFNHRPKVSINYKGKYYVLNEELLTQEDAAQISEYYSVIQTYIRQINTK